MRIVLLWIILFYTTIGSAQKLVKKKEVFFQDVTKKKLENLLEIGEMSMHLEEYYWDKRGLFYELVTDKKDSSQHILTISNKSFLTYNYLSQQVRKFDFLGRITDSVTIKNFESAFTLGTNGLFCISDWHESYGTYIKIYNSDFEELNTIIPYPNKGFKEIENIQKVGDSTYILFSTRSDSRRSKVIKIDNFSGKVISDYTIPLNFDYVSKASSSFSESYLVMLSSNIINIIDGSGNIKSTIKIPYKSKVNIQIDEVKNRIFIYQYKSGELFCYELTSGKQLYQKNIIKFLKEDIKVTPQIEYLKNKEVLVFYFDKLKNRETAEILLLDKSASVLDRKRLLEGNPNRVDLLRLSESSDYVYLISQEKISQYEIQ